VKYLLISRRLASPNSGKCSRELNNASKSGKGIPTISVGNVWLINHYFAWICGIVQERGESIVWANGFGAFAETKAQEDKWVMHCTKQESIQ
jgi:hypothetical protein